MQAQDRTVDPARAGAKALHPWLYAAGGLLALLAIMWASDWVTVQNERTVYTADCSGGVWQGAHCTGELRAGPRYRFRALRAHSEVLFWTVGGAEPSGRLTPCAITNGRNWTCNPGPDAARAITLKMSFGQPVANPLGPTFHAVPKWHWWLLHGGITLGHDAAN